MSPDRSSNARSAPSGSVRSARRAFASYLIVSDRRASRIAAWITRSSFDIARPPPVMASRSHHLARRTRNRRTCRMCRTRRLLRRELSQAEGVLRRVAQLVVVEVGEDVASLGAPAPDAAGPLAKGIVVVVRGVAAPRPMESQIDGVRGHREVRRPVRRLSRDERDVSAAQEGERLVREPGGIAWLERVTSPARRDHLEEPLRALEVELHSRRELYENDRGLRPQAGEGSVRALDAVALDVQALDMGDEAIELDGVDKVVGHGPAPLLERLLFGLPVEGVVQLDGVEVTRVVLEPPRRREILWIEAALPVLVLPARCDDPVLAHMLRA